MKCRGKLQIKPILIVGAIAFLSLWLESSKGRYVSSNDALTFPGADQGDEAGAKGDEGDEGDEGESDASISARPPTDSNGSIPKHMKPPTLVTVTISPEARVKATAHRNSDRDSRELEQGSWREFSIVIENAAGITAPLKIESEQLMGKAGDHTRDHWMRLELKPAGRLSGKFLETRRLRIYSRDAGYRSAVLNFNAGQGTQDIGFRSDVLLTFKVKPSGTEANRVDESGESSVKPVP